MARFRIDTITPHGPQIAFYFSHLSKAIVIAPTAPAAMSARLINAAFDADGGSDSDEPSPSAEPTACALPSDEINDVEQTVPEQTMSQPSTASALVVTPTKSRKRKEALECEEIKMTMPKIGICQKVKTNTKAMSQLADETEKVQSVFYLEQCIPLWPQYKLPATGSLYLKVAPTEQWFLQYVGTHRKACSVTGGNKRKGKRKDG